MPKFEFVSKHYPRLPGCYLMKDSKGQVIYVGKAKNLRRRLASYFQRKHRRRRTKQLVRAIRDIEIIIVRNETESLILETNLIKHYRPKFNRAKKSSKSGHPYIVLTDEDAPRFLPYGYHRHNYELEEVPEANIVMRFGPYATGGFRNVLLNFVRYRFQLRDCHPIPEEVCLLYHMHRCSGICAGRISPEDYAADIQKAVAFLSLQHAEILYEVRQEMLACAEQLNYERAQFLKEQLELLETALENQVVERHVDYDEDVIFCGETHGLIAKVRGGKLKFINVYPVASSHVDYLVRYYHTDAPQKVYIVDKNIRAQLKQQLPNAIKVRKPADADIKAIMAICQLNYEYRVSELHLST